MFVGLQVARGIAATLVVLFHATLGANIFYSQDKNFEFWRFGDFGVDFFFVLSGFIIYYVHSYDYSNLNTINIYLKKRLIRIYPPYLVITGILILSYNLFPSLSAGSREISILSSLTLIPINNTQTALNVAWTLMHEMLFYVTFILFFVNKKSYFTFLFIWLTLIFLESIFMFEGLLGTFFLNAHNIEFMFGILAAIIVIKKKEKLIYLYLGLFLIIIYISFLFDFIGELNNKPELLIRIYLGISFMLITIGVCSVERKITYPKFLIYLGAASYSIYLLHSPILSLLNRIGSKFNHFNEVTIFIVIVIIAILLSILYYIIVEKPLLKYLKIWITK